MRVRLMILVPPLLFHLCSNFLLVPCIAVPVHDSEIDDFSFPPSLPSLFQFPHRSLHRCFSCFFSLSSLFHALPPLPIISLSCHFLPLSSLLLLYSNPSNSGSLFLSPFRCMPLLPSSSCFSSMNRVYARSPNTFQFFMLCSLGLSCFELSFFAQQKDIKVNK